MLVTALVASFVLTVLVGSVVVSHVIAGVRGAADIVMVLTVPDFLSISL